jgi:hypothetical protein
MRPIIWKLVCVGFLCTGGTAANAAEKYDEGREIINFFHKMEDLILKYTHRCEEQIWPVETCGSMS